MRASAATLTTSRCAHESELWFCACYSCSLPTLAVCPVLPKPVEQGASQHVCGVQYRWGVFKGMYESIEKNEGGLDKFTQGAGELAL